MTLKFNSEPPDTIHPDQMVYDKWYRIGYNALVRPARSGGWDYIDSFGNISRIHAVTSRGVPVNVTVTVEDIQ